MLVFCLPPTRSYRRNDSEVDQVPEEEKELRTEMSKMLTPDLFKSRRFPFHLCTCSVIRTVTTRGKGLLIMIPNLLYCRELPSTNIKGPTLVLSCSGEDLRKRVTHLSRVGRGTLTSPTSVRVITSSHFSFTKHKRFCNCGCSEKFGQGDLQSEVIS